MFHYYFFLFLVFGCSHKPCGILWDLCSQTRDWTPALAVKLQSPNHWIAREFPLCFFFYTAFSSPLPKCCIWKCIFSVLFYLTFHNCSLSSVGKFSWTCLVCRRQAHISQSLFPQVRLVKQRKDSKVFCFSGILWAWRHNLVYSKPEGLELAVKSGKLQVQY